MRPTAALERAIEARDAAVKRIWATYHVKIVRAQEAHAVAVARARAVRDAAVDQTWAAYEALNGGDA